MLKSHEPDEYERHEKNDKRSRRSVESGQRHIPPRQPSADKPCPRSYILWLPPFTVKPKRASLTIADGIKSRGVQASTSSR